METKPSGSSKSPSKTSASKSLKSASPEKVTSSPATSQPKARPKTEPATKKDESASCAFTCPKCSRDFVYSNKMTANASFSNHVRRCDPSKPVKERPKKAQTTPKKFSSPAKGSRSLPSRSSKSPEAVLSSTPSQEEKKPAAKKSPEKKSPKKPASSEAASVAPPKEKKPSTPKSSPKKKSSSAKPRDNDMVVSLKNPRYKEVLFARFRELGPRKGNDENPTLNEMKQELMNELRRDMGGDGKFYKSDRHMAKFWEVDDEEAMFSKCFLVFLILSCSQ